MPETANADRNAYMANDIVFFTPNSRFKLSFIRKTLNTYGVYLDLLASLSEARREL